MLVYVHAHVQCINGCVCVYMIMYMCMHAERFFHANMLGN